VLKIGATTTYQLRKALSTIFKMMLIVARLNHPALDRLRDTVAPGELEAVLILSPDHTIPLIYLLPGNLAHLAPGGQLDA
jgi:hypothetical protein